MVEEKIQELLRKLTDDQLFAVLCTQGDSQPYGSLICFVVSDNLRSAVFATPIETKKYRLLSACDRVALVVDSRNRYPDDLTKISAFTATGQAIQLTEGEEYQDWAARLIGRHPDQREFVESDTTALFRVDFDRFYYVSGIGDTRQWIPK